MLSLGRGAPACLVSVVDEVAPGAVRTEADRVEGAARFRLVLGVSHQTAQFVLSVGELALVAVFAAAGLLVRSA